MEIEFSSEDFQPLDNFSLVWRWTQETHNVLPPEVLAGIQPLTEAKAKEMWVTAEKFYQQVVLLSRLPKNEPAVSKVTYRLASWDDFEGVRDWLRAQPVEADASILVFFDLVGEAAITRWQIFCDYWDDFCYPGDDIFVRPLSGTWGAVYSQPEVFFFVEHLVPN